MTPLQIEAHQRHIRFHAAIAARAALVPQQVDLTYSIPNTPFGVKKLQPMQPRPKHRNLEPEWWHCMWFFDLVIAHKPAPSTITVAQVIDAVGKYYGMSRTEMLSQRRTAAIVRPRQVAYYLSKKLTGRSLPEIGRRMGGRDHTSILSGIRKIGALQINDEKLRASLHEIAASLGGTLG